MSDQFAIRSWSDLNFGISETLRHDVQVLHLHGELDVAQVDRVQYRLKQLVAENTKTILDLSELTFFDASGIELLYRANGHRDNGWKLEIQNPAGVVLRTLELAGVSDLLLN